MIPYEIPTDWIRYDATALIQELTEAKGAIMLLMAIPYQRRWVDDLQAMQLKLEVAGTSKIEGADFTGRELETAMQETPDQLITRSQKQAHAATQAYRWIAEVPRDRPVNEELICEIHRLIVTGADDDHCPPGQTRCASHNVVFGTPHHRGVEGGAPCEQAFARLAHAIQHEFRGHDMLIQALAAHYHIGAMHPFLDGNGRTARAVEALILQRAGLRDTAFIAMSNYYYDEKKAYLVSLNEAREGGHDLTPFLRFALRGVAAQSQRLAGEIRRHVSIEVFRSFAHDLFTRRVSPRKTLLAERQLHIIEYLLQAGTAVDFENDLVKALSDSYKSVRNPRKAIVRDIDHLSHLKAISVMKSKEGKYLISIRLDWPREMTEGKFFELIRQLPKVKTRSFLSGSLA
jgi:Fic family protein